MGDYPAVSTFAGLAGAKLMAFVSPWNHGDISPPLQEPSGEGQSDLRDLFSLKRLRKHKSLLRKTEIISTLILSVVHCLLLVLFGTILDFEAENK